MIAVSSSVEMLALPPRATLRRARDTARPVGHARKGFSRGHMRVSGERAQPMHFIHALWIEDFASY